MRSYLSSSLQQPCKAGERTLFQDPGDSLRECPARLGSLLLHESCIPAAQSGVCED